MACQGGFLSKTITMSTSGVVESRSFDVDTVKSYLASSGRPKTYRTDRDSAINAAMLYAVDENKTYYVQFRATGSMAGKYAIVDSNPRISNYYEISPKGTVNAHGISYKEVSRNSPEAKAYLKEAALLKKKQNKRA